MGNPTHFVPVGQLLRDELTAQGIAGEVHTSIRAWMEAVWARHVVRQTADRVLVLMCDEMGLGVLSENVAALVSAPFQEWDLILCSSDAVRRKVLWTLRAQINLLQTRFGIAKIALPKVQTMRPCFWLPDLVRHHWTDRATPSVLNGVQAIFDDREQDGESAEAEGGRSPSGSVDEQGVALALSTREQTRQATRRRLGLDEQAFVILCCSPQEQDLAAIRAALKVLQVRGATLSGVTLLMAHGAEARSLAHADDARAVALEGMGPHGLQDAADARGWWGETAVRNCGILEMADIMRASDVMVHPGVGRTSAAADCAAAAWTRMALSCALPLVAGPGSAVSAFLCDPAQTGVSWLPASQASAGAPGVRVGSWCLPGGLVWAFSEVASGVRHRACDYFKSEVIPSADDAVAMDSTVLAAAIGRLIIDDEMREMMSRAAAALARSYTVRDQVQSAAVMVAPLHQMMVKSRQTDMERLGALEHLARPQRPDPMYLVEAAGSSLLRPDVMLRLDFSYADQSSAELAMSARKLLERHAWRAGPVAPPEYDLDESAGGLGAWDTHADRVHANKSCHVNHFLTTSELERVFDVLLASASTVRALLSMFELERQVVAILTLLPLLRAGYVSVADKPLVLADEALVDVCANLTGLRWHNRITQRQR